MFSGGGGGGYADIKHQKTFGFLFSWGTKWEPGQELNDSI